MKRLKKLSMILLYLLLLCLLLEFSLRYFLKIRDKASFFDPKTIIYYYYPELKEITETPISNNDKFFDILILDGSALNDKWGNVKSELYKQLEGTGMKNVKIYNVAVPAHTSLDSRIKFEWLKDKDFDLVIFYHGINEVRFNNCPDSFFKSNYLHYLWYNEIINIVKHKEIKYTVIPYLIESLKIGIQKKFKLRKYASIYNPDPEWVKYGAKIKTSSEFRKNLEQIIKLAGLKNTPVMVMTFAYYIPSDYSLDKFNSKKLDYSKHRSPLEWWGNPENVKSGMDAHNQVLKNVVSTNTYRKLYFIDMNNLIHKNGKNFDDACHFTQEGSREFASYMIPVIQKIALSYKKY